MTRYIVTAILAIAAAVACTAMLTANRSVYDTQWSELVGGKA